MTLLPTRSSEENRLTWLLPYSLRFALAKLAFQLPPVAKLLDASFRSFLSSLRFSPHIHVVSRRLLLFLSLFVLNKPLRRAFIFLGLQSAPILSARDFPIKHVL
jgi:hypothetical protein